MSLNKNVNKIIRRAYEAGYDRGNNGPTTENCRPLMSVVMKSEWDRGLREGEASKRKSIKQ